MEKYEKPELTLIVFKEDLLTDLDTSSLVESKDNFGEDIDF